MLTGWQTVELNFINARRPENSAVEHGVLVDTESLNPCFHSYPPNQMAMQNIDLSEGFRNSRGASQIPGLSDGANIDTSADPSSMSSELLRTNHETGGMHPTVSVELTNIPHSLTNITIDSLLNIDVKDRFFLPDVLPENNI
ncbi:uncharacterized protein A4U43_C07F11020 [Asparagus officinalis]|uniref:Uncharacterized protein n=1 Tax=Asparagus officinalis TaxID=4686 RepID=A0A5P1EB19_ASPOF|nr:uncharacterized protein A4U43_C07F11020 [Asparagus officinalis]